MRGEAEGHPEVAPARRAPCPLSEAALALLPYSFLQLDSRGTVLHVDTPGREPRGPEENEIVGRDLFQDLLCPPESERIGSQYRALVLRQADDRVLATLSFTLEGKARSVELVFSHYPDDGLSFLHLRETR